MRRGRFGDHLPAARSQPYYLDVTHPDANKGSVAKHISARYGRPAGQIATIGDLPNDVLMFAHSGLSFAMGNAGHEFQRAARRVTAANEDEGFARLDRLRQREGAGRPPAPVRAAGCPGRDRA